MIKIAELAHAADGCLPLLQAAQNSRLCTLADMATSRATAQIRRECDSWLGVGAGRAA